jgi:hypothetical protein
MVGYDIKSLSMTGFRIGPLDTKDPKHKGTYLVGLKEEGHTIANKTHYEETVFVKKVGRCHVTGTDEDWLWRRIQDPRGIPKEQA